MKAHTFKAISWMLPCRIYGYGSVLHKSIVNILYCDILTMQNKNQYIYEE